MILSVEIQSLRLSDRIRRWIGRVRPRRIVTLHHLACSGGTIMTKAIAALDSTMVLSEIHPDRPMGGQFHPLAQALAAYGSAIDPDLRLLVGSHFRREIQIAYCMAESLGRTLVVRDHAHVDFAWAGATSSRLVDELSNNFRIAPIVTIRDPREVWVSVRREGWFEGTPDELCNAHLAFLDAFPAAPVFFYEDFTRDPAGIIRSLCAKASIPFDERFIDRIAEVRHITGDSGRGGDVIAPRPPKALDPADDEAFRASPGFAALVSRLKQRCPDWDDGLWLTNRPSS